MLKTLSFCLSVCGILIFTSIESQGAGIAIISHANIKPYQLAIEGFREQVNAPVNEYYLGRNDEQHDVVAAAIRQQHPMLIFALGQSALNFTRKIELNVPVVFVFVLHPQKYQSSHQEFCIAMSIAPEQQFNMLLNLTSNMKRVGVVYDPQKSNAMIQQAKTSAKALGIHLIAIPASNQKEAAAAIATMMPNIDAMWMIPDTTVLTSTTFKQMTRLSLRYDVALIGLAPKYVRAGSLFALSFDSRAVGLQAGDMAKKILNGQKVTKKVSPNVVNFALNQQTADRLGLHISPALLKKANHLYPKNYGETK